jgi:hypothetical protein
MSIENTIHRIRKFFWCSGIILKGKIDPYTHSRYASYSYSLFLSQKFVFSICLLHNAPHNSFFGSANQITAKKGASKFSKRKGANSLGKFKSAKRTNSPQTTLFGKKEPNPRNEKNQSAGKNQKLRKNLDSPAENPDCFPYKKLRKNHKAFVNVKRTDSEFCTGTLLFCEAHRPPLQRG